jgi:hypothetical protein
LSGLERKREKERTCSAVGLEKKGVKGSMIGRRGGGERRERGVIQEAAELSL